MYKGAMTIYPRVVRCPTGKHPRAKLSKWPNRARDGWYSCKCYCTYFHFKERKQ